MLIGIDGNEANINNRVGVNMYGFELLWSLWKLQSQWGKKHRLIVYLKNPPLKDLPPETNIFKYKVISGKGLWIITKLTPSLVFDRPRPDVFFSPSHYVPIFSPVARICAIMDLGYLEFSEQFKKFDFWQLKLWSAYSILVSKYIIAISNSTKNDIVRHYPFVRKKIEVTHLAYNKQLFNLKIKENDVRHTKNKYHIVDDYILFLSTLKPSKNVEGLLEAYLHVKRQIPAVKLVIAGKKGWFYEPIFQKVRQLGLENEVIFTDYLPEEDKPALIKGARVFVLPSFWEGFGIDVLNAMACGVPVVVSDRGSLPEIAGQAGVMVDPKNPISIAKGITKVLLASRIEYNKLVKEGRKRANQFSWETTARKTLDILEKVVVK